MQDLLWLQYHQMRHLAHTDGEKEYAMQNVSPFNFEGEDQLLFACLAALGGLLLIVILERFAPKEENAE